MTASPDPPSPASPTPAVRSEYDEKLLGILRASAAIFAEKGYHRASIRDIAAATGISLSGLYYYFRSKEDLLFLIQEHCFGTLLERQEEALDRSAPPEDRLRTFMSTHLRFFLANRAEMKVLSHESDVLEGSPGRKVHELKRAYARALLEIVDELRPDDGPDLRTATFGLFGMMNWIYTWHRDDRDPDADRLAAEMASLFLGGIRATGTPDTAAGSDTAAPSIWRDGRS